MRTFPNYLSVWACKHPQEKLRHLANGETACDGCVSVILRANGGIVVSSGPQKPRMILESEMPEHESPPEPPRESPREDVPIQVVRPDQLLDELDKIVLGHMEPPKEEPK